MIPDIVHEAVHASILVASAFTTAYSLLRYRERASLALSSFWLWMGVLSIAVFINSAVHIAYYAGILPHVEHDTNLGVLTLLSISLAYYALALNRFQKTVLGFLRRDLASVNLLTYLDILSLFKGNVRYAVAYNMGRSYADRLYQASKGDMKALTSMFEHETGVKRSCLTRTPPCLPPIEKA